MTAPEVKEIRAEHVSLSTKTAQIAVVGGFVLIFVALGIGLLLHLRSLINQYTGHAFDVSTYACLDLIENTDTVSLGEQMMAVYRGLSEEDRKKTGTPDYREFFASLEAENRKALDYLEGKLKIYIDSGEVDDVYLAMFDKKTNALVYLVDPQTEYQFSLGEWESVDSTEVDKFLNWDGEDTLYDLSRMEIYGWMCTAGVPVRNQAGDTVIFVLSDVTLDNIFPDLADYMLRITLGMVIAIALIIFLMTYYIRKQLVAPINAIAGAAESYVKDTIGERHDHFASLNIHPRDEIENLSTVMAEMEKKLAHREERIRTITAEQERAGTELRLAHDIQEAMLPHVFPPFPERTDFEIHAAMDPAKEVGGDFYDFFLIDDHLCLVIADVSGKGVPAALYMMVAKVILQNSAMLGSTPGEILRNTNNALCTESDLGMFVTVWIGILELSTGIVTASNAGHEYPAVYRKGIGAFELLQDKHGFVVGGVADMDYKEYELVLKPGDKIFVYTDGVPEATRNDHEMFGTHRMIEALNRVPDASPKETLDNIRAAVDTFVEDAEQFDDLTMMCIEYKPHDETA